MSGSLTERRDRTRPVGEVSEAFHELRRACMEQTLARLEAEQAVGHLRDELATLRRIVEAQAVMLDRSDFRGPSPLAVDPPNAKDPKSPASFRGDGPHQYSTAPIGAQEPK